MLSVLPGRVCSTAACAVPGTVLDSSLPVLCWEMPGLQQPVLHQDEFVHKSLFFTYTCLYKRDFFSALGTICRQEPGLHHAHVLLRCTWRVLSTKAYAAPAHALLCCNWRVLSTKAYAEPVQYRCTCASVLLLLDVSVYNGHAEYREI